MSERLMTEELTAQALRPDQELVKKATLRALERRVGQDEVQRFVMKATSNSVPVPIGATASLGIAVWGKVHCEPDGQPWLFDTTVWGGPVYFGESVGFMYTAYETWDDFFRNVTACHAQGFAEEGGILQINWFNADGVPVGQFNGLAGGIGLVEAGGAGTWQQK